MQSIGDKAKEILLTNATTAFDKFKDTTNTLLSMCPSSDVMNDPDILSKEELQKQVTDNDKKAAIPEAVAEVVSGRRSISQLCQAMVNMFAPAQLLPFSQTLSEAKAAITVARTAVGVDFFIGEMNGLERNIKTEDAKAWAEGIEKQLTAKGCKRPNAINELIQTIKTNGLDDEQEGDEKESVQEPATKKAKKAS